MAKQTTVEGEEKLETDVTVGGREIQAVSDTDEVESVLGWMTIYTIGPSFTVEREWLEVRASELGIPHNMLPSEVTPKRAFTRASKKLPSEAEIDLPADVEINTTRDDYSHFDLEITDRRDGELHSEVIGVLEYDEKEVYTRAKTSNPEYIEWFQILSREYKELFDLMGRSNLGKDVRKSVRSFCNDHSTSVKMRDAGAVYFVPAHYQDHLEAFQTLISDIDEHWKDEGFECRIDPVEVIDSPSKRQMVEEKVQKQLTETVDGIVEEALEKFDEERAANEVVSELGKELASVESLAVEHNTLLNAEMSVQEALENWKDSVKSEQEALVQGLVDEVEV